MNEHTVIIMLNTIGSNTIVIYNRTYKKNFGTIGVFKVCAIGDNKIQPEFEESLKSKVILD